MSKYTVSELWAKREEEKKRKEKERKNTTSSASSTSASASTSSYSEETKSSKYTVSELWAKREEGRKKEEAEKTINFETFFNDLNTMNTTLGGIHSGWHDADTMTRARGSVANFYDRLNFYEDYRKTYGAEENNLPDLSELVGVYKSSLDDWDNLTNRYGQYSNADAYNKAVKAFEEEEAQNKKMREANLLEENSELAYMESNLRTAKKKQAEAESKENAYIDDMDANAYTDTTRSRGRAGKSQKNNQDFIKYMNSIGYSSVEELESAIAEKKAYISEASSLQNDIKLASVADKESNNYDKDFDKKSEYTPIERGFWDKYDGMIDDVYTYINGDDDARSELIAKYAKGGLGSSASTNAMLNAGFEHMTDDEKRLFNYYFNEDREGQTKAKEYWNVLAPKLKERKETAGLAAWDEFTHESNLNKVLASGASVATNLASGVEQIGNYGKYMLTGELDDNYYSRVTNTIRGRVAKDVDWNVDLGIIKGDAFDFLYNTTMSGIDSAASVALLGGAGGVNLGLSAAASATNDALDRGFTDEQALTQGFMSGAFEMLFETISIGRFLDEDVSKGYLKNLATSMFVNATEEGATELANIVYDAFANGDLSNYAVRVQELVDSGVDREEAEKIAKKEFRYQIYEAMGSGALMGGGFTTANSLNYAAYTNNLGKTIRNNENVGNVFDLASIQLSPEEKSAYEAYERYTKKGINAENIKNGKLGNLAHSLGADAEAVLDSENSTPEERAKAEQILQDLDAYIESTSVARYGKGKVNELFGSKEKVDALIENALTKGENTEAYKLATEYKAKLEKGKSLSEKELTKLVDATTGDIKNTTRAEAEKKLTELGETENAEGLAKIISKVATGQKLSSTEIEAIRRNENAINILSEMDKSSNVELMEVADGMDEADAELFLETYDGESDIDYYKASFDLVSDLAKNNYSADFILEHKGALTEKQVQKIYNNVVTQPIADNQAALNDIVSKHEGNLTYKANIDDRLFQGKKGEKIWRNLNKRQRQAITFVKAFAKGAGINLKFTDEGVKGNYNGYYDSKTNTIVIDIKAGVGTKLYGMKDAIIPTMSHELTHWMKQKSPELYAELSQKIFNVLKTSGKSEYDFISEELSRHPEYTDDQARDEVIARACEDLFSMSEEGRKIFNSLSESEQKTLTEKIKNIIKNIVDWVNELLGLYESKSEEATMLRNFKDELLDISKTWDNALASAVKTNAALNTEGVTASEVFGKLHNGISEDGTTIIGEGNIQMSERTYREGGRDYLMTWLKRQKGLTKEDKEDIVRQTDKVAEIMRAVAEGNELPDYSRWANLEVVKDEKGEKVLSVIVKNGDYTMNIDFSQVCKKRVALNAVLNAMVQSGDLNVHVLTETDVADLNAIIKKHDFEIACALCFVDSKRYRVGAWAESFCEGVDTDDGKHKYGFNEMVRSLVPEGSKINIDEFNFTKREIDGQPTKNLLSDAKDSQLDFSLIDKIMSENDVRSAQHRYARAIKENPQIRKILNSAEIISSIGLDAIRLEAPALYSIVNGHQGTAKPKFSHDAVAYGNDVLKARGFTAKKAKMVGGVRCQSFSDFMANMVMDYAQFISELSAKQMTAHSYTKEPLFVKLFGLTGMKINMSLVPKAVDMTAEQQKQFAILKDKNADKNSEEYKTALAEYEKLAENAGLDENGNYIWEDETFPYDIAMEIVDDPRYSANCGTIAVGISKAHILKLLADDKISMVIPYHKSGLNRDVAMMRDIALYHDYTSVQNTRYGNDASLFGDSAGKKLDKEKDKDFDFYGDLYGKGKKEGTHDPKKTAQNYLDWCDKHNYTPRFDEFRDNPNYYKLLVDFRVYDTDGTYREQQAVKPIYPGEAEFKDLILNGVKDKDGKVYGGLIQSQENSDRLKAETKQIVNEYRGVLKEKYGKDVLAQFSPEDVGYKNKIFDFGITQNEIDSYVERSYRKENDKSYIKFLEVSDQLIEEVSSDIDLSGYAHALRDNDIRHIRNSHGEMTNEKYPVTQSDIQMIPFVIENYDKVFYKTNANKQPGLLYVKVMPENVIYYVEAITEEYGKEKLLINKQLVKTGINGIPNLPGVIEAINKKMSSSQYLADLEKIRKAYVQDVKENYSNKSILNSPSKINDQFVNNEGEQLSERSHAPTAHEVMGELKTLENRYKKLEADYGRLKEKLKIEKSLTKGKLIVPSQIDAVARHLLKFGDSNYSKDELVKMLNDLYVDLQDGATSDSMAWDEMYSKAYEVAEAIRSEAKVRIERPAYYDMILKDIRSARISPNEGQKGDAKHRFGDHYVGKFRGRVTIANDGTPLDEKWSEWASKYPSVFDKDIGDAQQLVELYDIYDDLRNAGEVVQEYEESEMLHSLATEIVNKAWLVTKYESTADKYDKRIKGLNFEHRKAMDELKDTYKKKESDAKLLEQMYYGKKLLEKDKKIAKQRLADDMHYGKILNELHTRRIVEVDRAKQAGRERLAQYKENAERKNVIKTITNNSLKLTKMLTDNNKDSHVPEAMKGAVKELLEAIDASSKKWLETGESTKQDISLNKAFSRLKNVVTDGSEELGDILEDIYGSGLEDTLKEFVKEIDNGAVFFLNEMSIEDLKKLDKIVKIVKTSVNKVNMYHSVLSGLSARTHAIDTIRDLDKRIKVYKDDKHHFDQLKTKTYWNNLNPYYAFKNLGGSAGEIFTAFQNAQDKLAFLAKKVIDFADGLYTGKEYKKWSETYFEFSIPQPSGKIAKFSMNVPQIMSLYCVIKQEDAKKHILHGDENGEGGGITIAETKDKRAVRQNIRITEADLKNIISKLDDKSVIKAKGGSATAVADKLQEYMGTRGAELGNEITMARWGIKSFGIENYFPIKVSEGAVPQKGDAPGDVSMSMLQLLNASFTHSRNHMSKKSVEIGDVFDVFSNHMSNMVRYNAFALPILDMYKWINYKNVTESGEEISVQGAVKEAFGDHAWGYLQTFLKDVSGASKSDTRDNLAVKFFKNSKVAKVAGNMRVALLQFTSFIRAGAVMDNKYLLHALHHKPKIERAEEKSGIVLWKALGYYDTDITRGLTDKIKHDENLKDKVVGLSLKGAELADKVTMGVLWNACELEIRDTRKDLKVGSDEFNDAVALRLRDIIYKTQVVDSMLTRSQMMRSPSGWDKMLTTFASESTLSLNLMTDILVSTHLEARETNWKNAVRKNGKYIRKAITAYVVTNIVTSALQSVFDAFRDYDEDDKDEKYWAKLMLENFAVNSSVFAKIPYINLFVSALQGFTASRADTEWMNSTIKAGKEIYKLMSGSGDPEKLLRYMLKAGSDVTGVAAYNVYRDVVAFYMFLTGNGD